MIKQDKMTPVSSKKKERGKADRAVEDFSTPTKTGYIDILQEIYGDKWLTPNILKNDIIRQEIKSSKKKLDLKSIESDVKDNSSDDLFKNDHLLECSGSDDSLIANTKKKYDNNIYVSDSGSEASSLDESPTNLENIYGTNKSTMKQINTVEKVTSSGSSSEDSSQNSRKLKKKQKSLDSFIVVSSESSTDTDDANTPAYYNRLNSLIQKSVPKEKSGFSSNVLRNNFRKNVVKYFDSSSSADDEDDDGDRLVNATICAVDDDEEIDSLSENIIDIKLSDNYNYKKYKAQKKNREELTFLESLSENVDITLCHKDAIPYLKNFKRTREKLSRTLFNLYNEQVFDNKLSSNMDLIWCNSLRTTGGLCQSKRIYQSNGVSYVCSIKLSTKVVDRPCRLRDTLIHELCHAANFEIDKIRDAKHSSKWKYWTRKAEKCFPELPPINTTHNYIIEYNFAYRCSNCSRTIYRHKNSFKETTCYCGGLIISQRRQADGTYKDIEEKRTPSEFARFVKENYNKVNTPERNHKDCMKELSKLYSQKKLSF